MGRFVGKRVKLVGQVAGTEGSNLKLKTADDSVVQIVLAGSAPSDPYVEFEGIVESPTLLKEESQTSFGNNFDLSNYNELCKLSCGEFAQLFM